MEIATALARSGRNARVLDYLVQTWDTNILGIISVAPITVPEIIAQRCTKIVSDLHVAGWPDSEVTEFFVALSLLPPPIPLEELASALGWSATQVNTAASDLAPMLEIASLGAIFRDEPTETNVREAYSERPEAQRAIADRLLSSQATSAYAAEALPHFLVVIKDSDRKQMREYLGDGYTEALRAAWPGVPQTADLVMYWWHRAAELVRAGKVRRFGLITTNSITQQFNRVVVRPHISAAEAPLRILFAVPDHPWVDNGAAVRIAMSVGAPTTDLPEHLPRLGTVLSEGAERRYRRLRL